MIDFDRISLSLDEKRKLAQEIRSRISCIDLFQRVYPSHELIREGSKYKTLCVFHNERNPSLYLFREGFICFGCGEKGDVIRFWKLVQGYRYDWQAIYDLGEELGILDWFLEGRRKERRRVAWRKRREKRREKKPFLWISLFLQEPQESQKKTQEKAQEGEKIQEEAGKDEEPKERGEKEVLAFFLSQLSQEKGAQWGEEKRGIPSLFGKACGIRYVEDVERIERVLWEKFGERAVSCGLLRNRKLFFRNHRVIFPIYNHKGELVNLLGRQEEENPKYAKYIFLPGRRGKLWAFPPSWEKYLPQRKEWCPEPKTLFFCEGILDAVSLVALGYAEPHEVFALNGKDWQNIPDELLSLGLPVKIAFDRDEIDDLEKRENLRKKGRRPAFVEFLEFLEKRGFQATPFLPPEPKGGRKWKDWNEYLQAKWRCV